MLLDNGLPASLAARLERLADDQRRAATAPIGPILCVAPAGSGKTTTLVARIAWLVASGILPSQIAAITFNRAAAIELSGRLAEALDWLELPAEPEGAATPPRSLASMEFGGARPHRGSRAATAEDGDSLLSGERPRLPVRVRTFHALGLEILRSRGRPLGNLVARETILRQLEPRADRQRLAQLDAAFSRLKLDLDVSAEAVDADPEAGPIGRVFVAYERALSDAGAIDFDDLVRGALHALQEDPELLAVWRGRCSHLLVDETQDVDRSQLRLALLLAAPANRIFLVGDDDQS